MVIVLAFTILTALTILWWACALWKNARKTRKPLAYLLRKIMEGLYLKTYVAREKKVFWTVPNIVTMIGIGALTAYLADLFLDIGLSPIDRVWLLIIAALSDVLDGFYARSLNQCTPIGRIMDPARDKLFVLTIVTAIAYHTPGTMLLWLSIVVLEAAIAIRGWILLDNAPVHVMGKIRMAMYMVAGACFVAQEAHILPVIIAPKVLLFLMFCATVSAAGSYFIGPAIRRYST